MFEISLEGGRPMDTEKQLPTGKARKKQILLAATLALVVCLNFAVILSGATYLCIQHIYSVRREGGTSVVSPDGRYKLWANEWTYGLSGVADLYIKPLNQDEEQDIGGQKYIATVGINNGYNTFSKGYYHVEWEEDQVTIFYYKNHKSEDKNDRSTWLGVLTYELE
jgi:hypothetical protein